MTVNEVKLIYFSPTCTSKQVAEAIVQGMGTINVSLLDITLEAVEETVIPTTTLALIVAPVYGGHIAPLAMERLNNIRGTNTPVVLVAVYGNRAYEKSLVELDDFATAHGLKVIAGATFVGEHSYSSEKYPIAAGRPDESDLELAFNFGKNVLAKVTQAATLEALYPVDVSRIRRPRQPLFPLLRFFKKVIALRKSGTPLPRSPWVENESLCSRCGLCAKQCPVHAIVKGDELHTDADKCIKCCACVKSCPKGARVYDTPFAVLLSQCFKKQKEPQTIL